MVELINPSLYESFGQLQQVRGPIFNCRITIVRSRDSNVNALKIFILFIIFTESFTDVLYQNGIPCSGRNVNW